MSMQTKCAVGAVLLMLLTASVEAAHGYYDPASYPNGGFAPATDAKYQSECGSCHFAYLPGLLPARSWEALLKKPNEHFGETLSLDPDTLQHIRDYLTANAGDRSDFAGPQQFFHRMSEESTPLRIRACGCSSITTPACCIRWGWHPDSITFASSRLQPARPCWTAVAVTREPRRARSRRRK